MIEYLQILGQEIYNSFLTSTTCFSSYDRLTDRRVWGLVEKERPKCCGPFGLFRH